MQTLFNVVANFLIYISGETGYTYHEVNILVYYLLLPLGFFFFLDRYTGKHYLKLGWSILWLLIFLFVPDFSAFSTKVFDLSVEFLLWFNVLGMNYVQASVVICVFVPLLLFAGFILHRRKWENKVNS